MGPSDEHDQPGRSLMRASDAERNRAIEVLATACAEGRLSLEEYSQRSEAVLAARTAGDLAGMTADLPGQPQAGAVPVPGEITAVLGNESRKGPWVVPAHLTVRSVLGDCHLEMQQAAIRQHVTTIDATARFGSVTIFVPDGIDVRMTGRAVLGAKSSELRGEPRPGAPVIVVHCDVFCGAITVRGPNWAMRRAAARQLTAGRNDPGSVQVPGHPRIERLDILTPSSPNLAEADHTFRRKNECRTRRQIRIHLPLPEAANLDHRRRGSEPRHG